MTSFQYNVDELLTLMGGTGALVDDELEELLSLTSRNRSDESSARSGREGRTSGVYNDPLVAQEIRSWVTLADRAATGNGSAPSSSGGHASLSSGGRSKNSTSRKEHSIGTAMFFMNKSCWAVNGVSTLGQFIHCTRAVELYWELI